MFCVSCGHALETDARFCDQCGAGAPPQASVVPSQAAAAASASWKGPVLASVTDPVAAPLSAPHPSGPPPARPSPQPSVPPPGPSSASHPSGPPPARPSPQPPVPPPGPSSASHPSGPPPARPSPQPSVLPPGPSSAPQAAGRSSGPAPGKPSTSPVLTALVAALVVVAVLMGGGYLAYRFLPTLLASWKASPTPTPTSAATETPPTPAATETSTTPTSTPTVEPTPESTVPPLEAFAGEWTNPETPEHRLRLTLEQDTLVARIAEENAEVRLARLDPEDSTLHGSYTPSGEASVPMTAELSPDRSRMTLTLAPPQSEFERAVLVRPESLPANIPGIEEIDRSDPESYLPLLHQRSVYEVHYPDGDSGNLEVVTSSLDDQVLRSELETATSHLYPDSGPRTDVFHYFTDQTGLRRVLDSRPDDDELWLPARVGSGMSWKTEGWFCRVLQMQAPVDLGFVRLSCLKVQRDNPAVGVSEIAYFAPGYGEVLVKLDGAEAKRLLRVESLEPGEATELVRKHSQRLQEVKQRR